MGAECEISFAVACEGQWFADPHARVSLESCTDQRRVVGYFEIRLSLTTPLRRAIVAATVTDRLFDVSDIVRLLEAAESKKAA